MKKPLVAIIGRPNVGKSTLFNRITGTHSAIVEDIPGVTRDRHYREAVWGEKAFSVVDTGGFYPDPPDDIFQQAKEQALFAVDEADIIIHLLDGKEGLTPSDIEIARLLRVSGKRVLWAVNKIDGPTREDRSYDFYRIGEHIMLLSSATGYGYGEFMESLAALLPLSQEEVADYPKIAVVGRPNVGKSTLVNALLGKNRMIVSPLAGTTRDAVDSICTYHQRKYLLIDTAGIRRKAAHGYSIERFAMVRTLRSIERCDVALLLLDAGEGITEQDQKIAGIIKEAGKGLVLCLNKWDCVEDAEEAYPLVIRSLYHTMWFAKFAPAITISGLSRKRVTKIFPLVDRIMRERTKRIPTGELNRFFGETMTHLTIPSYRGRSVKLFYITQVEGAPPAFVLFCNYRNAIKEPHLRQIERLLRERFAFEGTPIRLFVKSRRRVEGG